MKQAIRLRGRVQELAAVDVEGLIGAGQMARIRSVDQEPFFFQMTLAHEGTSTGSLSGVAVVKEWLARVVRAVAHAFSPQGRIPAAIYDGIDHWHGNEADRVSVGEVVDARPVASSGLETANAIGWVYRQFGTVREFIRSGARDCCSIEADVEAEQVNGRIVVQDVLRGVAVVLGHTSKQTPGFAGARIRKLTEFGPENSSPPVPAGELTGMGASATPAAGEAAPTSPTFSKADLISAIKSAGIQPGDIWPAPVAPVALPAPIPTPAEKPAAAPIDPLTAGNPFLPQ